MDDQNRVPSMQYWGTRIPVLVSHCAERERSLKVTQHHSRSENGPRDPSESHSLLVEAW